MIYSSQTPGRDRDKRGGQNTKNYYLVWLYILALRLVAPASFVYCLVHFLVYIFQVPCPTLTSRPWLTLASFSEVVFFLSILRKRCHLEGAPPKTGFRTHYERDDLFYKCCDYVPSLERFLTNWFQGARVEDLRRDDIKDFLAWTFAKKSISFQYYDCDLDHYITHMEGVLGRTFPPGRGCHQAMRLSLDPLQVQHKPLVYYLFVVGFADVVSYFRLRLSGFDHYRLPLYKRMSVFPWRPQTIFSRTISPSEHLSYFYRPHSRRDRRPVLFIHGFGHGISKYSRFLKDFDRQNGDSSSGVGIIALEIMPLTTRINEDDMLPMDKLMREIRLVLAKHGWNEVTVLAHSVGTTIATQLLQHFCHVPTIGPMVLVDPIAMTLHWGEAQFNLLYREPRTAAEREMRYLFGADMTIAHSVTQEFGWQDSLAWRTEFYGREVAFLVSGEDLLVGAQETVEYLSTCAEVPVHASDSADVALNPARYVTRQPRAVILHEGLGHGEVFDSPENWRVLKGVLHQHCRTKDD
ncbi:unnamed protein product [Clonostachys solani]|uniref:AB hydrolase-1 domain-containing protein n=1 Tax=Clonostachys solani TaxID=160281 RepID=A0A9N9YZN6_9HYPO|nr:unnamed protein product [Clonostachys solani]